MAGWLRLFNAELSPKRYSELRSCAKVEDGRPGLPLTNNPYDLWTEEGMATTEIPEDLRRVETT